MKSITKPLLFAMLSFFALAILGCNDDDNGPRRITIVDVVSANGLTTLENALDAANLTTTLQTEGSFTVFAPSNSALDTFIQNAGLDLDNLSQAEEELLRNILLNHVILGEEISSSDIVTAGAGYESSGATGPDNANLSLYYRVDNGTVTINGQSDVTDADNTAANGVVHVVDAVIELPTVVTFAVADPTFSQLEIALTTETPATDFASILSRTESGNQDNINPDFTVFAPTDAAFQELLDSNMDWDSLADIDDDLLTSVLLHHVIAGNNARSTDLNNPGDTIPNTLVDQTITITLPSTNGNLADVTDGAGNDDIGVIVVDVQASNGVIHVLNKVLVPGS